MDIDHVVLWVADSRKSVDFYVDVLGMEPVRLEDFEAGSAPFPSVRLNATTILDLMEKSMVPGVQAFTAGGDAGGAPINHLCLSMNAADYAAVAARLVDHGVSLKYGGERSFGAQGTAERSEYFCDPDGNVIEIRHYG